MSQTYSNHLLSLDFLGNCALAKNEADCFAFRPGMICVWVNFTFCMERSEAKAAEVPTTNITHGTCDPQKGRLHLF